MPGLGLGVRLMAAGVKAGVAVNGAVHAKMGQRVAAVVMKYQEPFSLKHRCPNSQWPS